MTAPPPVVAEARPQGRTLRLGRRATRLCGARAGSCVTARGQPASEMLRLRRRAQQAGGCGRGGRGPAYEREHESGAEASRRTRQPAVARARADAACGDQARHFAARLRPRSRVAARLSPRTIPARVRAVKVMSVEDQVAAARVGARGASEPAASWREPRGARSRSRHTRARRLTHAARAACAHTHSVRKRTWSAAPLSRHPRTAVRSTAAAAAAAAPKPQSARSRQAA
jgi:hypothetical protein